MNEQTRRRIERRRSRQQKCHTITPTEKLLSMIVGMIAGTLLFAVGFLIGIILS